MSEKIIFKPGISFFRKHHTAKEAGAKLAQQQKLYVGIIRHYLDQFLDFPVLIGTERFCRGVSGR